MPTKKVIPIKPITAWSYSRYNLYQQCPLKFKFQTIDKIWEPKNDAMKRGADLHDLASGYIKGALPKLDASFALFEPLFNHLRKQFKKKISGMVVEDNWAFRKDWSETQWNDWAGCWVRLKLDAAYHESDDVMIVIDWKTGKFRPAENEAYVEQLELYALAALLLHPHLKEVWPQLVYTDQGLIYPPADKPLIFVRADAPRLQKLWEKRVRPMMSDTQFAPRPNDKCTWCFYGQAGKKKGGPGLCKF